MVQIHRRQLKVSGLKRVEVKATESDAALIRQLAKMLRSEGQGAETARQQLAELVTEKGPGLKVLLASGPLAGIRLTRSRDPVHIIELWAFWSAQMLSPSFASRAGQIPASGPGFRLSPTSKAQMCSI